MDKQVYLDGYLRDVYPLNYLNSVQLGRMVDRIAMRDWIAAEPHRGTLELFRIACNFGE